jgi:DNA polymerase-1
VTAPVTSTSGAPIAGALDGFGGDQEIWPVDFEFVAGPGERPAPLCLLAMELRTGRVERLFGDDLLGRRTPPYPTGPEVLIVAYLASAELGCHLVLGWPMPARILDLYAEFSCRTAGLAPPCGRGLLGALAWYGQDAMSAEEKDSMRALVLRGGPYSAWERAAILDYCAEDVDALARLLPAMAGDIDVPRAPLRGRYMAAVASMESAGVPIDMETLARLREHWDEIKGTLIAEVDRDFRVFEGRTFKAERWAAWLAREGIPWPVLDSGAPALDDDTFREIARFHPKVSLMRELRHSLSQMRLAELAVGADGRNRCLLSPFRSKTGRNQPSNNAFIFGTSAWLRGLIKPREGRALAYLDWSQQEFGIAGALSGDPAMLDAYASGDPYLTFGKQAGQIPAHGTKETHGEAREVFKTCVLGVQYGMSEFGLARRLGLPRVYTRELLRMHRETYPTFWAWSDGAERHAMLLGSLHAVFGWTVRVGAEANPRSLRNFPCQANGAEMLRLACCLATERGIQVCAPVHDAILVEGPADSIDEVVAETKRAMREASEVVLDGFALRADEKVIKWPDRYSDKRGVEMWDRVMKLLPEPA